MIVGIVIIMNPKNLSVCICDFLEAAKFFNRKDPATALLFVVF